MKPPSGLFFAAKLRGQLRLILGAPAIDQEIVVPDSTVHPPAGLTRLDGPRLGQLVIWARWATRRRSIAFGHLLGWATIPSPALSSGARREVCPCLGIDAE